MTEYVINCAGTSTTTGTTNPVVTGSVAGSRTLAAGLTDGQVVACYRRYSSGTRDGYENFTATWDSATNTLEYDDDDVEVSSNGNLRVDWGAYETTISVVTKDIPYENLPTGTTAETVAAGDDVRFDVVDVDDMDAADDLDGTELVAISQGGDGVSTTTEDLLGYPFLQKMGHAAVKSVREHSDFSRIRDAFTSTNGGTLDLEPYLVTQSGTGAGVSQGAPSQFGRPAAVMTTGTDTNGYVSVQHLFGGFAFAPGTSNFDHRKQVLPAYLSVTGEVYYFVTGYMLLSGSTITQGMYFAIFPDEANYKCIVKDAAGETQTDSGVAVQTSTPVVLRVWYDPAALATKFYINGTLVQTILDTTRAVDLFTVLRAGSLLFKSSGTTARTVQLRRHTIDVLYEAVPYF